MVEVEKQDSDWLDSCFWRFQDNVQWWYVEHLDRTEWLTNLYTSQNGSIRLQSPVTWNEGKTYKVVHVDLYVIVLCNHSYIRLSFKCISKDTPIFLTFKPSHYHPSARLSHTVNCNCSDVDTVWTVYFIQKPESHRPKWKHKHINTWWLIHTKHTQGNKIKYLKGNYLVQVWL